MPHPDRINPHTGKRYGFTDPHEEAKKLRAEETELKRNLAVLERQKAAIEARDHLMPFVKFTMPDTDDPNDVHKSSYKEAEFHKLIAEVLEDVEQGEINQLIFVMPPRHGKTELATKRLAAWYSGRHPEQHIAVASYSDTMAEDMGADTRAILTSSTFKQVFPQYKLRRGGTSKSNIQTVDGGRIVFVGRGGPLTGRGMHLGIGDDLFKDHEEARSQATRDTAWNWFVKVFMTRRMGKKRVILTFTRWHPDDIIGRLTDPNNPHYNEIEARKWKIIRLPAIAEEDDPLGREPGEPLWPDGPDKFDLDFLQSQQRLDPLGFSALYQQRPTVADGILFRRESLQFYNPTELPEELRIYCASDHAVGTAQRNDPSCLLKVGVDRQENIYLLDCIWRRMPTDQAVEAMLAMAGGNMRPLIWWAERGHISKSIGPFLHKRMSEERMFINLVEVTPAVDKEQRAQSIAARTAMGKVYFPKSAWWLERALDELLAFPNGTHDDFVDTLAYIGLGLESQYGPSKAKPAPKATEGTFGWLKKMDAWHEERKRGNSYRGF